MAAAMASEAASITNSKEVDLNNVGCLFHDQEQPDGADRSPTTTVDSGYGSLASVARLTDEVDDITQQTTRASLSDSTYTVPLGPDPDSRFYPNHLPRDTPVYTSWQPRCIETEDTITPSLDDLPTHRRAVGSSLAPQSSSEGSTGEAPKPVVALGKRPSHDRPLLPANPVRYQNPPRSHEEPIIVLPPRIAQAPQQQPQIAPRPLQFAPQTTEDYGCSECGKLFNRKSDLVHHKRYHTRNFDRPYKCDECGQGFIHYKDLARHMPRHTGQRSFQCPFSDCDKTYTRKDNLNRHVRHDHAADPNAPLSEDAAPQPATTPVPEQKSENDVEPSSESASGPPSVGNSRYAPLAVQAQESTPTTGKRPIDEVDSDRPTYATKTRRQPKEKWAHRLGCPFRKCKPEMFTTSLGYRVCVTTPHEFTIRLLEHLKRNHELFVCGDCFLAFTSPEFLTQHKNSHVHCAECYLSFPDKTALTAHSQSCLSVDSSTQEDVWQILYETICSDGVRHNPVFGEDEPIPQSIERSNTERMARLSRQPKQQGQVLSLQERLRPSTSSPASGNGSAPPVSTADQRERQQKASVGASPFQTGHRVSGGSDARQYQSKEASHLQGHVSPSHPVLSHDVVIAPMMSYPVSEGPEIDEDISGSVWHLESLDMDFYDVATLSISPIRSTPTPVLKSPSSHPAEAATTISALPMAVQAYYCPSLTSESTMESQEQRYGIIPYNIPQYSSMGLPHDPNILIKQRTESFQYSWHANISSHCGVCGVNVDSDLTYCGACFGPPQ